MGTLAIPPEPSSDAAAAPAASGAPSGQERPSAVTTVAQQVIVQQTTTRKEEQINRFHVVTTRSAKDATSGSPQAISATSAADSANSTQSSTQPMTLSFNPPSIAPRPPSPPDEVIFKVPLDSVPPPPPLTRVSAASTQEVTNESSQSVRIVAPTARRPPTREEIVARFANSETTVAWYHDLCTALQRVKERFAAENDERADGEELLESLQRESPASGLVAEQMSDELLRRETLEDLHIEKNPIVQRPNLSVEQIMTDDDRDTIHEQALLMQWALKNRTKCMMPVKLEEKLRERQEGPPDTTQAYVEQTAKELTAVEAIEKAIHNLGCSGHPEQLEAAMIEFITKVRAGPFA